MVAALVTVLSVALGFEVWLRRSQTGRAGVREPPAPATQVGHAALLDQGMAGVVAAAETALAFQVPGRLTRVQVRVGEVVKPGAPIAELDPAEAQRDAAREAAQLQATEAAHAEAQVKVRQARDRLERLEATAQFNAQEKLENARLQLEAELAASAAAEARVALQREAVARARLMLEARALRAPFAGTISMVLVERGASVAAAQPIARIIESGDRTVRFAVPEGLLDAVQERTPVVFEAGAQRLSGEVKHLAPGYDTALRYRFAVASLPSDAPVPVGTPVTVRVVRAVEPAPR